MTHAYDAIVVGGGPAGSAYAFAVARRGRRVLLLEKDAVPSPKVCGGVLSPRCLRIFERLGLRECVDAIPSQEVEYLEVELASGGRLSIPFASVRARVVDRCALDAALWKRAGEAGAELCERTTVTRVCSTAGDWRVETSARENVFFSAPMLAAADGRNSFVARQIGLPVRGGRNRSACFQYCLRRHEFSFRGIHFFIFDGGYCGLSVDGTGMAHLDLISLKGGENESHLRGRLFGQEAIFVEKLRRAEFIPSRPVTRSPIGSGRRLQPLCSNVVLLGDAQQWVEPFTGEGISLAIESAHRAAEAYFEGCSRFVFPSASWVNPCVARALARPALAHGMVRLLNRIPWLGRWMAWATLV